MSIGLAAVVGGVFSNLASAANAILASPSKLGTVSKFITNIHTTSKMHSYKPHININPHTTKNYLHLGFHFIKLISRYFVESCVSCRVRDFCSITPIFLMLMGDGYKIN